MSRSTDTASNPHLRPARVGDLRRIHEFQLDPESNTLAGTKPRTWEVYSAAVGAAIADPRVRARVIVADAPAGGETLLGMINCFVRDEQLLVGYWIGREHWGRGVASRAVALILAEEPRRPLRASVASHNAASLRVLQKNGFHIAGRRFEPETDRYLAGEVVDLIIE